MVPAAIGVLLVPFFFASWGSEYLAARAMLRDIPKAVVGRAVRNANAVSYCLLGIVALVNLAIVLFQH